MASIVNKIIKKKSQHLDLIFISIHEAGHAILYLLNSFIVNNIVITKSSDPTLSYSAYTTHQAYINFSDNFTDELKNKIIIGEISSLYAGLAAEKYYFKVISGIETFPMVLQNGCYSDNATAAKLIKSYNLAPAGKKRYLLKKKIIKETEKTLQNYWEDVLLISKRLIKSKKIDKKQLKRLLTTKSLKKDFWKKLYSIIEYLDDNHQKISSDEIISLLSILKS